jgi:hypothetical protein
MMQPAIELAPSPDATWRHWSIYCVADQADARRQTPWLYSEHRPNIVAPLRVRSCTAACIHATAHGEQQCCKHAHDGMQYTVAQLMTCTQLGRLHYQVAQNTLHVYTVIYAILPTCSCRPFVQPPRFRPERLTSESELGALTGLFTRIRWRERLPIAEGSPRPPKPFGISSMLCCLCAG